MFVFVLFMVRFLGLVLYWFLFFGSGVRGFFFWRLFEDYRDEDDDEDEGYYNVWRS